jgi:hypothetical protein
LSNRLQLNERDTVHRFHEYLIEKTVVEKLKHLKSALSMIQISLSECERGFSQINLIIHPTGASLITKTMFSLPILKIVGAPLTRFNPAKYVDSFMLQKCHSATDKNGKEQSWNIVWNKNLIKIWNLP